MVSNYLTQFDRYAIVIIVLFSFSTLTTITRCYLRAGLLRSFGIDDYLISVAGILELVLFPLQYRLNRQIAKTASLSSGRGPPRTGGPSGTAGPPATGGPSGARGPAIGVPQAALRDFGEFAKIEYTAFLIYIALFCVIKLSILAFYHRFLPKENFAKFIFATAALTIIQSIISFFISVFQCNPISDAWDPMKARFCPMDKRKLHTATGAINLFVDLVILFMPVMTVLKLNMRWGKKCALLSIFSVGIVATIATAMQLRAVHDIQRSANSATSFASRFQIVAEAIMWTQVEVTTATICANFPTLTALWKAMRGRSGSYENHYNSDKSKPRGQYSLSKGSRSKAARKSSTGTTEMKTNGHAHSPSLSEAGLTDEYPGRMGP